MIFTHESRFRVTLRSASQTADEIDSEVQERGAI